MDLKQWKTILEEKNNFYNMDRQTLREMQSDNVVYIGGESDDQFLQLQRIKMLSKICNNGSCTFFMTDDAKELPVKPVLPLQLKTKKENNKE